MKADSRNTSGKRRGCFSGNVFSRLSIMCITCWQNMQYDALPSVVFCGAEMLNAVSDQLVTATM